MKKFRKAKKLLFRAIKLSKENGIYYVIKITFNLLKNSLQSLYYRTFYYRTFTFQGRTFHYFYHEYGTTWKNERAVEVPIIWEVVRKHSGKKILEVGNVLSHYFPVNYDILDKYEKAEGVINRDVVDFQPSKKYDLIVSISTLEHVGYGETPQEPLEILRAIENLRRLLASGGQIVFTLPLGENPNVDKLLREGKIPFTKRFCLKRISKENEWKEVAWDDICYTKYGDPFPPPMDWLSVLFKARARKDHT